MTIKQKNIYAVVFDLDGILVDTASIHSASWKMVCEQHGLIYTNRCYELTKGRSRMQSLLAIIQENNAVDNFSEKELDIICREKNSIYIGLLSTEEQTLLFDNSISLLKKLKKAGLKLGLASSSKNAKTILRITGIEMYFDSIVTGSDAKRVKPFPDIYQINIDKLGFQGENCIAVEDAYTGIISAKEAGLHTIYVGEDKESIKISEYSCGSVSSLPNLFYENGILSYQED